METRMATRRNGAWAGWIAFASTILIVVGLINMFQGFLALIADEHVAAARNKFVLVDMTSWGWTLVVTGVIMLIVGGGLLVGATWARVVGIVVVCLHAVTQIGWLGAYPIWALLMIGLDTAVLFALPAGWGQAVESLRSDDSRA